MRLESRLFAIYRYSDPPLKWPPPLNEPPAILSADLSLDPLHFTDDY